MAVEQRVVRLQQEGAAPLGDEVVTGHIGAPVAQHFRHVAQPHCGQFEGPLEPFPTGQSKQRTVQALGGVAVAAVATQHLLQGAGRADARAHQQQRWPGATGGLQSGVEPQLAVQFGFGIHL